MKISKNMQYIGLAIVLVLIIAAIVYYRHKGTKTQAEPQSSDAAQSEQAAAAAQPASAGGSYWEGTLQLSNNPNKGNLMLTTATSTIYISTSRDFSDLIGKQVKITYQGTTSSFELGDITAK